MGSAALEGGISANIHELCFQAAKRSDMDYVEVQMSLFAVRMAFSGSKRSDKSCMILKRDDLLMLRNSVFTVRNVEICAVMTSYEFD